MKRKLMFSLLVVFVWFKSEAQEEESCDASCQCMNNLTPAGVMISHVHPKGEWMFSYRYMNMQGGGYQSGRSIVEELTVYNSYIAGSKNMNMNMHMIMGMYGITDRITAMLMLNYYQSSMEMTMLGASHGDSHSHSHAHSDSHSMEMYSTGISDTKLQFMFAPIKNSNSQLILNAGVNLPTGSINEKGAEGDMLYDETRMPYMMQLGSGTYDFLPGLTFIHQKNNRAISGQMSSVLRLSENKNDYRLGNEVASNVWLAYNWWNNFSSSIRFEGIYSDMIIGKDPKVYRFNEIGANPLNYGGTKINSYLGLSYHFDNGWFENFSVSAEYGLPIFQKLNGIQNPQKRGVFGSLNYKF